tara:strand:+ start:2053 stop:2481 length:429 start_codon:yes stop_codon:yes gene_type:complete
MGDIFAKRLLPEYWEGFEFDAYNYYIDKMSVNLADLDSVILEYSGRDIIVISHPIYFCPDRYDSGDKYPFAKKLYYYVKVPYTGLTINNLFIQINKQSREYKSDFIKDLDIYSAYNYYIEDLSEITKIEYRLMCRVWVIDTD